MKQIDLRALAMTKLQKRFEKCTWEILRPHLEEAVNAKKKDRITAEYSSRNNTGLRALFSELYLSLPTRIEKNTFLPILDFLDLSTVRGLLDNCLPEDEFRPALSSAIPSIKDEVETFCASMRRDLADLWCTGRGCPGVFKSKSDSWLSEFLSLARVVFVMGDSDNEVIVHYPTLFKRQILGSLSVANRVNERPVASHPNLDEAWTFYRSQLKYSHRHYEAMCHTLQQYFTGKWEEAPLELLQDNGSWEDTFSDFLYNGVLTSPYTDPSMISGFPTFDSASDELDSD
ncbi:hypothetical protein CALCODRAFT_80353 [Calocera cornea HHB12733]|uniref:Uncharacterized protein n=1 Tax=Calocera cornea HHB12733 TaxID=1353952 RepID=A0A165DEY1_9BASI|nr:hypothetical protein CALCODRAFT_80353 [Calocera cornea HHB12733]